MKGFIVNFTAFRQYEIKMKTNTFLKYLALTLGIIYATMMLLLAVDSLPLKETTTEPGGFLIHFAPGLVIILVSVYGSVRPKYGRYVFLLITVVFTIYYETYKAVGAFMGISFPLAAIAFILFLASLTINDK